MGLMNGSTIRAITFVFSAAFIVLAPAYRQVFGASTRLPRWEMFSSTGLDVYEVTLEAKSGDGPRHAIDRYAVLGYDDPLLAPRSVRLITRESEAWALASRICARLGPDAEVYMRLRDATRHGWPTLNDGQANACKAPNGS